MRILLIEDDLRLVESLGERLRSAGFALDVSTNGVEGLYVGEEFPVDLAIIDLMLPDGDGIEMVRYVQSNHPDIPIAVFTAHGNMETAVKALKAGAFDFVSKPVDIQILRNLVSAATSLPQRDEPTRNESALTITGQSPALNDEEARALFGDAVSVYLEGEAPGGRASTIIDLTEPSPLVLRDGPVRNL